jgi:AcrR family transcriptional regulator
LTGESSFALSDDETSDKSKELLNKQKTQCTRKGWIVLAESRFAELREKEKEARKQIVVESALALFAKKPFYEVGMREVADEAGISPATIYRYFPSQEELFHEAFIQEIASASTAFKSMVLKDKPASIEEFGITFVDHLIENESTFQMMTYLMLKNDLANPVMGKFDSVTKIFFDLFEQLLVRHGVKKENARLYSHSFIASLAGILMTFRNYPLKNKKAIKDHIIKIIKITSSLYSQQLINK